MVLRLQLILSLGVLVCLFHRSVAVLCDLKPRGAVGEPNSQVTKYRIVLVNNPEKYVPGQTYNVILQGKKSLVGEPNKFNGFVLTVEPSERNENLAELGPLAAGVFKLLPEEKYAKIDEFCPNTIVHTSLTFVPSLEVLWTAPNPGIGCVRFRASVMEQHMWYKNDKGLELNLCEQESFSEDSREKCCSCNEAKYEMKFEGLWTRQSHPRFYPDNSWLTRFSDVIGASHAYDYRFWKENERASPGLIEFSEKEITTLLESEIKSNKTRTVIKAKGLSHPNITDKTFAVFRVDQEHHLLSLISILRPSPDWFVGISGLSLCDDKCRWTGQKTLELYPYDLGLYADLKYESKSKPTDEPIHLIDHTNIEESPFYTNNKDKLKPLARVHLMKAREYEKECDNSNSPTENTNPDSRPPSYEGEPPSAPTRKPSYFSRGTAYDNTESSVYLGPKEPSEQDWQIQLKCEQAPFSVQSKCSLPECDLDRVRIVYKQLDERMRENCLKRNIVTEKLEECERNCSGGKSPPTRSAMEKCTAKEFLPSFNPCDKTRCVRNRTRTAEDPSKKSDRDCLNIYWFQEIECQPQDCSRKKKSRRKPLTNKYNVTISASYTYAAEHKPQLCANNNASNTAAG